MLKPRIRSKKMKPENSMRGGAKCGRGFTTKMRCTAMNVLKTERKTLSLQAAVRLKHMVRHSETEDQKMQRIFIFLI